jgi:hypothetical protein
MPNKQRDITDQFIVPVRVTISLVIFKEDGFYFAYSPALHVYGFDKNKKEAFKIFIKQLDTFIQYSINNNTLIDSLLKMGWKNLGAVKKPKMVMPELNELLEIDPEFKKIHLNKDYSIKTKEVKLPIPLFED